MSRIGLALTAGLAFAVTTCVVRVCRDEGGARPTRTGAAPTSPGSTTSPRSSIWGRVRTPAAPPLTVARPRPSPPDLPAALATHALRNAIDEATLEDMFHREVRIEDCLDLTALAQPEKLRFITDIEVSETRATIGTWRFDDAADGAAVSEAAIDCAERALGGDLVVAAPDGQPFPSYAGPWSFVYRIPAASPTPKRAPRLDP